MARFSEILMDHFASPRNSGRMEAPDRIGLAGQPGAGPFLFLQLKLEESRVVAARFQAHGCGATIAAGSLLTELIIGRTMEECRELKVEDVIDAAGGFPSDKLHCPALAAAALRRALDEVVETEPT